MRVLSHFLFHGVHYKLPALLLILFCAFFLFRRFILQPFFFVVLWFVISHTLAICCRIEQLIRSRTWFFCNFFFVRLAVFCLVS